jgi:DNA primase catalytic core
MIPEDQVQEIIASARIEDVIGDFVTLKKQGNSLVGLCPFHDEKSPSFNVNAKGFYHCFGCGKSGDSVNFIMEHQKMSFPEALKYLADRYHIKITEKERTEEEDKAWKERESIYTVNAFASRHYAANLKLPENKPALDYVMSRFTDDEIVQWQIGYASDKWDDLLFMARKEGYSDDILKRSTLIKESEKATKLYDYFRGRIMFPIHNIAGRVVGFGGRTLLKGAGENGAKYINTTDTPVYHKSTVLYGLNHARAAIAKADCCHVVEGYTDVIRMHCIGIENTVAPCGTALTREQITAISRYTKNIVLVYDGDQAGVNATVRNGELCLQEGMYVSVVILPEGEDPDSFFRLTASPPAPSPLGEGGDLSPSTPSPKREGEIIPSKFITENKIDYIFWRAGTLMDVKDDPRQKHVAFNEVCRLMALLDMDVQSFYTEELSKRHNIPKKQFQDKLKELNLDAEVDPEEDCPIPDTVDVKDYQKWGFYEYQNEYFFRGKESITRVSNFIMRPLFHVESINDTRRIYELINYRGFRVVVDFTMQEMTSLMNFKQNIEGRGNYLWWGTDAHMNKLKLRLYEETRTCYEVRNLGWQNEGYWAWSNGILDSGSFKPIDENGLVEFNNKYYFIPAFSKIYIDDKSIFIDDRKFLYRIREITMRQWAEKFIEVFGDNAKLGIAYWIAALFRDFIMHIFKNFPILNLFGPKGTGKSQMAMSLSCLFGVGQTPFNIHNGTKAGLAEHIQQFINAFAWIDEYKNSLDYDKIETLKSIYDSIGRSRLNMDKRNKKETTLVNSAVILSGQEMPTADVALFSRVIFLQFHKTQFTTEEKKSYDDLKAMERDGLSHLSAEIIGHRKYFEKHFYENYEDVLADVFTALNQASVEDRILRSICTILAALKTLEQKVGLPFTYEDIKVIGIKSIKDQNSQISRSNELAIFWEIIEALFDENILVDRWTFKIDTEKELKLITGAKLLEEPTEILKLKFSSIYKLYAEHARRTGQNVLPNTTLKYYLENSNYWVGIEKSSKFTLDYFDSDKKEIIKQSQTTTAYCFDYKKLGINLMRINENDVFSQDNQLNSPDAYLEPVKTELPF